MRTALAIPAMPLLALAYLGGTAAGAALGGPWQLSATAAGLLAAALALTVRPRPSAALLAAAVLLAGAAHARFADADTAPLPALASLDGVHEVVGVARDDATLRGLRARVDLDIERIDGVLAEGGLRLVLPAPREPIRAGDRLAFTGRVEPPEPIEDFDYAAFLRSRGIHAVAAFPARWEHLERDPPGARDVLLTFRRWAVGNIERSLPEPAAALASGVLIGERRSLPPTVVEELRVTGTTHLVVVSGQNVALLLGSAIAVLTTVMSRRRAAVVTLLLLPGYVVLVAADPPVVRAAIMAVGIAFASVTGRRTPGWVYLLYACAAMLALEPMLARDVAFQLSATATAGVMLVAPPLRDAVLARTGWHSSGPRAALVEVTATATGATLAVTPVLAAAFDHVSLIAIPANVAVAPLYEATLVVAVAAALLGWIGPVADALGLAGRYVPDAFLAVVKVFAYLPGAIVPVPWLLGLGAAWFAALTGLAWALQRLAKEAPALDPARRTGVQLTAGYLAIAGGLWLAVLAAPADVARVTVLDVGQGLAVLVSDGGSSVLIDVGPPDGAVLRSLPGAGVGRAVDAILLTHEDADHAGALADVERRIEVGALLATPRTLDRLGLEGIAVDIGDRIRLSARTTIEVLSPPVATAGAAHASPNNGSLVLLVTIGDRRVLLPADIEAPAEAWLVASGWDLRADALVVPHQGSRSSSTPAFVEAVRPSVAIASAGLDNQFGHPHEEVVERYAGVAFYRTDHHGSVTVTSDGTRLWVRAER